MKKICLSFFLTMLLSMMGTDVFAYDAKVNGIYYNFSGNEATVTYLSSSSSSNKIAYTGDVIIPVSVTYNGKTYSVTRIGYHAFYGCTYLPSITIPNSVTSIGNYAFDGCTRLTSITIPNSVTSIGSYAFRGTAWYDNQPEGLVYAGKIAYEYKGTMPGNTSITIKEGTLSINSSAFSGCVGLSSVFIPESVTSIGSYAFYNCTSLTSITIPNNVMSIGSYAFYYFYFLFFSLLFFIILYQKIFKTRCKQ